MSGDGFTVRAPYVVGADGLGSTVRRDVGITLPTQRYDTTFLLGDVFIDSSFDPEDVHVFPGRHGLLFFGPTSGGLWRLIITTTGPRHHDVPTLEEMQRHVDERGPGGVTIKEMTWAATFQSQHGMVDRFGYGTAALIGDSAHTHSPTGGQGLNTGIQDGYDLAATLAAIHRGADPLPTLDGFRRRRHAAATEVLRVTHRIHRALTSGTRRTQFVRAVALTALQRTPDVRRRIAHTVSSVERTPQATGTPQLPSIGS